MNYPDDEMEDGSSESSYSSQEEVEDEYDGNSDLDGHLRLSDDGNDLAAGVNALADRSEAGNAYLKRREERINELQERFREHERLMEQER